jgi:hypothetical protein
VFNIDTSILFKVGEGSNSDFGKKKKTQTLIPTKCSLKLTSSKKCFYAQSVVMFGRQLVFLWVPGVLFFSLPLFI